MLLPLRGALAALVASEKRDDLLSPQSRCAALQTTLKLANTQILNVTYIPGPTTVSTPGSCVSSAAVNNAPLCRVQFVTNTTSTSALHGEAWLPDVWYGRFLGLGNAQVGGCVDYTNLDYATSLHFAVISTDNGHDGLTGLPFLNHPEVINDFGFRSVHTEAILGKQIVQKYYSRAPAKSYYMGCSTGGRQGIQEALKYPNDFDGIVAGSPATDWNNLLGWAGMVSKAVGAPAGAASPSFLTTADWALVTAEALKQCDGLDGLVDGIINEPNDCKFDPTPLLCAGDKTATCLTAAQVTAVKNVFSPLRDSNGALMYPQYDIGAQADGLYSLILGGNFFSFTADWTRYAVKNVTSFDFTNYSLADIKQSIQINPGSTATWNGDLSAFRRRGGKLLTFHGRRDPLIPSSNSKRMYDMIAKTLKTPSLDDFYRLFLIPGMGHCTRGIDGGPTAFGQGQFPGTNRVNDTQHNILLALVDWVEKGKAPNTITGTSLTDLTMQKVHCRYPIEKSVWDGSQWVCKKCA
ncbi:Carboxylic ester hydrolase [Mycena indigotica]|uniref:Carboxylic ester hydrolase n=1 Tax=Mycena indigotica TaxID=2126181 RepID=A0A8H6SDH5_9AGAR|nr:Carboxylic ester hydrolase [Mycena indigotica]KAF7296948.1 Carboxylic ester hydrolase [Mycena indigotica]